MPEVIIKYKSSRTLQALKDFAKYFDFIITTPKKDFSDNLNGVTIIPADQSINTSDLKKIFTGKNIDAKELRSHAWQKKK